MLELVDVGDVKETFSSIIDHLSTIDQERNFKKSDRPEANNISEDITYET